MSLQTDQRAFMKPSKKYGALTACLAFRGNEIAQPVYKQMVSASSVQGKFAAPAAVSGAKGCNPDARHINQDAATDSILLHAHTAGAELPKRSFKRKLLVDSAAGLALGVATHVAASAATISAVAAAALACKTETYFGMLGGIFSKALDLAVLPVSLVSVIAA